MVGLGGVASGWVVRLVHVRLGELVGSVGLGLRWLGQFADIADIEWMRLS